MVKIIRTLGKDGKYYYFKNGKRIKNIYGGNNTNNENNSWNSGSNSNSSSVFNWNAYEQKQYEEEQKRIEEEERLQKIQNDLEKQQKRERNESVKNHFMKIASLYEEFLLSKNPELLLENIKKNSNIKLPNFTNNVERNLEKLSNFFKKQEKLAKREKLGNLFKEKRNILKQQKYLNKGPSIKHRKNPGFLVSIEFRDIINPESGLPYDFMFSLYRNKSFKTQINDIYRAIFKFINDKFPNSNLRKFFSNGDVNNLKLFEKISEKPLRFRQIMDFGQLNKFILKSLDDQELRNALLNQNRYLNEMSGMSWNENRKTGKWEGKEGQERWMKKYLNFQSKIKLPKLTQHYHNEFGFFKLDQPPILTNKLYVDIREFQNTNFHQYDPMFKNEIIQKKKNKTMRKKIRNKLSETNNESFENRYNLIVHLGYILSYIRHLSNSGNKNDNLSLLINSKSHGITPLNILILLSQESIEDIFGISFEDCMKLLVDNGADLNLADSNGIIPLKLALDLADLKIISMLIKNGADINLLEKADQDKIKKLRKNNARRKRLQRYS